MAEDIAAESFIKAWQKRQDFASLEKLKAFLFVVAHNAALDYLRAKKLRDHQQPFLQQQLAVFPENAEEAYIRAEALQAIYRSIESLPPQCRQVVKLSVIDGLAPDEIAKLLNISYKTVRNQKSIGLKTLRLALLHDKLLSVEILVSALLLVQP